MNIPLKSYITGLAAFFLTGFMFCAPASYAQILGTDTAFKPYGKISGYAFGDYYYKVHADSLHRGGANQYTGIPGGRNAFQFRRIYLGYDYFISRKFTAQILLAAEDANDDLQSNKYSFYIKYANVQWKNFLPRTDLIIGQTSTPAFSTSSDPVWGYRSVERTIADIRRTPSYDLGIAVRGKINKKGNFGYNLMAGNGTGAKGEKDKFKHFYGDIYAVLFGKKLKIDLYGDYERMNWQPGFHHARSMQKLFIGYITPAVTLGAEGFITFLQNDVTAINDRTLVKDTLNGKATGISLFVRGPVIKNKLGFFARMDQYNPDIHYNKDTHSDYASFSPDYNPRTKEQFITAGLDFTPVKNVHLMPNVWFNNYTNQSSRSMKDYDLVYRLTFYFIYK